MGRTLPLMIILLCLTASPVLAEEVLYCTDTEVVGFRWDKAGKVSAGKFDTARFTIKVVSSTERTIAQMVGDTAGCLRHLHEVLSAASTGSVY